MDQNPHASPTNKGERMTISSPKIANTPVVPPNPPFSFSNQTADTVKHIYPMTPGNTAPALIVWLYLVTQNNWLDELDRVKDPTGEFNPDLIPIDEIAKHTNLTADTVRAILAVYIEDDLASRPAWRHVVSKFQEFAWMHTVSWHPDDCPKGGILSLAVNGAIVDAKALVPPPLL
jgi:hypothetical protein